MARLSLRFERTFDGKPLCFRHAVLCAQVGIDIQTEVVQDSGARLDTRQQYCEACANSENRLTGQIAAFEERQLGPSKTLGACPKCRCKLRDAKDSRQRPFRYCACGYRSEIKLEDGPTEKEDQG